MLCVYGCLFCVVSVVCDGDVWFGLCVLWCVCLFVIVSVSVIVVVIVRVWCWFELLLFMLCCGGLFLCCCLVFMRLCLLCWCVCAYVSV